MTEDDGAATALIDRIRTLVDQGTHPVLVALDGRSGAGKSTLAAVVRARIPSCSVIDGDDFYSGGTAEHWDSLTPPEKAAQVIDWRRQRKVLESLAQGLEGSWHGYDWEAFDGRHDSSPTTCEPAAVIILEGAYSARPELADLIHLRVVLDTETSIRRDRLLCREGAGYRDEWEARWSLAEEHYFSRVMPPEVFDLVV